MAKRIKIPDSKINLKEAQKTISRFSSGLPPDIPYDVVVNLFTNLGVEMRSTKEGVLIDGSFHVNLQHRNGGNFTIHRRGFSQALRYAKTVLNEMN